MFNYRPTVMIHISLLIISNYWHHTGLHLTSVVSTDLYIYVLDTVPPIHVE